MKNPFRFFKESKVKNKKLFQPEKQDPKIIDKIKNKDGDNQMFEKCKNWFKERRPWWSVWLLVLILMGAGMIFGKCEVTVKFNYDVPPVVKNLLSNK